ncbi:hypothetical protein C8Q74DRAFT_1363942 [Fomes fomentarius]|nr:hypothetical protein C8Q74DRAFT_1363942 [Fomes fomentarius]
MYIPIHPSDPHPQGREPSASRRRSRTETARIGWARRWACGCWGKPKAPMTIKPARSLEWTSWIFRYTHLLTRIADLKTREVEAEIDFVSEGAELTHADGILPGALMDDVNTQIDSVRIRSGATLLSTADLPLGPKNLNLKAKDISNNLDLYKERDTVCINFLLIRLIEEARARNPLLPPFVTLPLFILDSVDDKSYFSTNRDDDVIDASTSPSPQGDDSFVSPIFLSGLERTYRSYGYIACIFPIEFFLS